MNTGQMLLTLGALVLLSLLTLQVNSGQLSTQVTMQNSKFGILAISIASSFIEEATEKAFDENSTEDFVTLLSSLTSRGNFGPDNGEKPLDKDTFDDFDDYHGFATTITDLPSAVFSVVCTVIYVDPDVSGFISLKNTWHKQITVTVTSPSMSDEIQMSKVFSYWKFP